MTAKWELEAAALAERISDELSVGVVRRRVSEKLLALEVENPRANTKIVSILISRHEVLMMRGHRRYELPPLPKSAPKILMILKDIVKQ